MPTHPPLLRNLLLVLLVLPAAASPQPVATEASIPAELARIERALVELQTLLRQQLEGQTLGLLLQRVEVAGRDLREKEAVVERLRSQRAGADDELANLASELEQAALRIESGAVEAEAHDLEIFSARIGALQERARARKRDLDLRLAELESELATLRRSQEEWLAVVDQRLQGR